MRHKRGEGVKVVGRADGEQGDITEQNELRWCEGRMRSKET